VGGSGSKKRGAFFGSPASPPCIRRFPPADQPRAGFFQECRESAEGRNNGHPTAYEVGHERGQAVELAVQPMVLHRHVLALDVAGFVEALRNPATRDASGDPALTKSTIGIADCCCASAASGRATAHGRAA